MFVSDKLIFVELHKTASTHVKSILSEVLEGESVGKHNQLSRELLKRNRVVVGSIRNPWDWYVSLWGYGCDGRGGMFDSTANRSQQGIRGLGWTVNPRSAFARLIENLFKKRERIWQSTYRDVEDAEAFRRWLRLVHTPEFFEDLGEGFAFWPGNTEVGLMTYRYLSLFCVTEEDSTRLDDLASFESIVQFEKEELFIDSFVRQESLEDDLGLILQDCGSSFYARFEDLIARKSKENTSSRKRDLSYYYDQESCRLVAERERVIIAKFGYNQPLVSV